MLKDKDLKKMLVMVSPDIRGTSRDKKADKNMFIMFFRFFIDKIYPGAKKKP